MSWLHWIFLVVYFGYSFGNNKPAVRVRITQKGLDYAIDNAMDYAKAKMKNYPLPDKNGKLANFFFDVKYSFTNMTIYNINISDKSLRPVPRRGLYTVLRNINFDIKGKWKISMGWFANYGTFNVAVQGMSVGILIDLGVNGDRLVVSRVTCASRLDGVSMALKSGQGTSYLFLATQQMMKNYVKSKIPRIVCEEGRKAIRKHLNKQFSKFPVKQNLKRSVTLDYSVVKRPEYKIGAVDLFLKGEFQPADGSMKWQQQPADLPRDYARDRMMYVTMMDHMINSASHAYYNQDAMRVKATVKQVPQLHVKGGFFNRYLSRINTGLGLIKKSACANCDLHITMEATSPPQIRTSHSGIHLTVQATTKINVVLPGTKREELNLETNITATAVPKLNGTKLSTNITDLRLNTRVINPSLVTTLSGSVEEMKEIVKKEVEKLLENGISGVEIPLPLSEKFQLVEPRVSYGEGYMTLETDILLR
ncbi:bactericidal permeability-increasing protein-like [Dendronephthya gigantea]|uniref:bactericidal permeability-increasing protein-like n=1 Tax=Dendronephthya gigantea TaxID=151771 RepID=UPI00106CD1B3|nr:bactericidal permeability-increasing protein-like [Dendronephthya gigantea]